MNLYRLTNGIGDFWVIDKDPTRAQEKLEKILDESDYGFSNARKVSNIALIAEAVTKDHSTPVGAYDLTNKFLIL